MRILGIDCGSEYTGYGVIERGKSHELICITAGAIKLKSRDRLPQKLAQVFEELCGIIRATRPTVVAVEEVFYSVNAKSALKLGQVRGVALLAAATCGLEVAEYAPLTIKSSVVGYGKAEKHQVQTMVARLLRLESLPEPADAADALAIAICHMHTRATLDQYAAAPSRA